MKKMPARIPGLVLWTLSLLGGLVIFYSLRGSNLTPSIAYNRGKVLVAKESHFDLGLVKPTDSIEVKFEIQNVTSRSINIVGIETACGCMSTSLKAPRQLDPGKFIDLPVRLDFSQQKGAIERDLIVHTDATEQRTLNLSISAIIAPEGRLGSLRGTQK